MADAGVGSGGRGGSEDSPRAVCPAATTWEARVSLRRHVGAASRNMVCLLSHYVRCLMVMESSIKEKDIKASPCRHICFRVVWTSSVIQGT